jgi:hypothetical protein
MSRAGTYVRGSSPWIPPLEYPLNSEQITKLVEPLDVLKKVPSKFVPVFDTCYFYNNAAGTAEVATYQIMEQLVQHLVGSMHLTYPPLCRQEKVSDREEDIWVEMPPLSIEKVVMQARDMGFGEPLAFLDPLPEE